MPFSDLDYGSDRYEWRGGLRYRTGFTRSIPPQKHETRAIFEARMNVWAERLAQLPFVADFAIEIMIAKGQATLAIVHVTLAQPELAPIEDGDADTPTAPPKQRGGRGGSGPSGANGGSAAPGGSLARARALGIPIA